MKKEKLFSIKCENEYKKKYFSSIPGDYEYVILPGCGETVNISINDIIPGRKIVDLDEHLCFYWKCPNCAQVRKLDNNFIDRYLSIEKQKLLLSKYAGYADLMYKYWKIQKEEYQLEKKLYDIRIKKNQIFLKEIQDVLKDNNRDTSRLYPNWDTNENVLKKSLKKED